MADADLAKPSPLRILYPPLLLSLTSSAVWWPGEAMEGDVDTLGVYACKEPSQDLALHLLFGPMVIGTVELWGEIVEYTDGYRAQFAKVRSFEISSAPEHLTKALIEKYNAPGLGGEAIDKFRALPMFTALGWASGHDPNQYVVRK